MRFIVSVGCVFLLVAVTTPVLAQTQQLRGVIVTETGRPIVDAHVEIVGTRLSSATNADGVFIITGVSGPAGGEVMLRVRRIGYQTLPRPAQLGATDIRIVMSEVAVHLDEIVVTGTAAGTQARAIANPITRVDVAEVVSITNAATFQDILSSGVPSVNMISSPGNVGTGAAIKIRGVASVSLGSTPLVYLDGVRIDNNQNASLGTSSGGTMRGGAVSRLNDLNPEDIESVEVIKGPAAATLFGTEASAGVIQITTKKGSSGAPVWDVTIRQGATWLMDPVSRWPAVYDTETDPCTNCVMLPSGVREFNVLESEIQRGIGTPWVTGHDQTYSAAVRGGTGVLAYYFSGTFDRDEGYVDWNHQNKYNARANLDITPSEKFSLSTSMGYVRSNTRYDAPGPFPAEIVSSIYWGTPRTADSRQRGWNWTPPEALATVVAGEQLDRFIGSATLRHNPVSWFTHRFTAGTDIGNSNPSRLFPRSELGASDYFGALSLGHVEAINRSVTNTNVEYAATVFVNLLPGVVGETSVGAQYYTKETHEQGATGDQFPAPGTGTVSSAAIKTGFEDFIENKTFGLYVQQQLGWKNRRFVTVAIRGDDNSAFGENFTFVVYPKFSATWVMHEEPFWNVGFVNALKLRGAWGRAGRQPDVFAARRLFAPFTAAGDQPGLTTSAVGNPDLEPEVGEEVELGFDAGFLQDRVSTHFTYYNKKTKDAIIRRQVAPSSGFAGNQFVNVGLINNRGIELQLEGRVLQSQNLEWDIGFAYNTNHSKVVSLGGLPDIVLFGQRHVEGLPVGGVFVQNVLSAEFDASGNIINDLCEATPEQGGGTVPCSEALPVFRGPAVPTWEGSATTSLRLFRNLRLFALVDFQGGYKKISGDLAASHLLFRNSRQVLEREIPVLAAMDEIVGDWLQGGVMDAGFARLRNVSVTYTMPQPWARKIGASAASFSLAVRNLATLWEAQEDVFGRREFDAELSSQYTSQRDFGAYHQTKMPAASTLTGTLRLTF